MKLANLKINLKLLALSCLAVFAPIKAALTTVFVLIAIDLLLGLIASKKRKEKLVSAGLRRTIVKLFVYEVALMVGFLAQQFLMGDLIPVASIVSSYIGLVEVKSIFENLDEISGGNLLASVLGKLNSDNLKD